MIIRRYILLLIQFLVKAIFTIFNSNKYSRKFLENFYYLTLNQSTKVHYNNVVLEFFIPNQLNRFRIRTFSTKEPETLEWIDEYLDEKTILWDVGANVGLYSIYAAKKKNCCVYSFEPSVFNIELLAKNIYVNNLQSKIHIIPLPLDNNISINKMRMSSTNQGGALSSFNHELGHDGKKINSIFEYSILGLTMDKMNSLGVQQPNHIKIDVDGIEHFILQGGIQVLKNCKSILIEINDDFVDQAKTCKELLSNIGFTLTKKQHGFRYDDAASSSFSKTFNQIWVNTNVI